MVVTSPVDGNGDTSVERMNDLSAVLHRLDSGGLEAAGVDIPIGLPESGPRRCDVEARAMIGPRRSSVFPAPIRALLGTTTYDEALTWSRRIAGKGLSRQCFGILPKIAEVDRLMTPDRQRQLVEVHPEVSFFVLTGAPMSFHKATPEGRAERLVALRRVFSDIDARSAVRLPGTQPDDVLDAYAAAWTAERLFVGEHRRLGGDPDAHGLRMEIIA